MNFAAPRPTARMSVLEFQGNMSTAKRNRLAVLDIVDGIRLWRLALSLGWLDIRLRYRGSVLGPFWLTISTGVMVGALGVLYAALFHIDVSNYLPFLALSQVLWGFIATIVSDGCAAFTQAEGMIRAVRMPLFVHAIRTILRNVFVLAHNIAVIVVVFAYYSIWPGWYALLSLPGLLVWMVDGLAVCLLLGAFCARFRDIAPIVTSVMQIAFFLTPVIWKPEQLGPHARFLPLNPFFDFMEVVRAPLLGAYPGAITWIAMIIYSIALIMLSWLMFVKARGRVAFWV
jgi:lipopolysaccharide transport system permease protein